MYSAVLITDLVGPPVAYATLLRSLWLPYVVGGLALLLTYPIIASMPETLPTQFESSKEDSRYGLVAYKRFSTDWRIVVGLVTIFLAQFRVNTIDILLPYTSIRFGWSLGKASIWIASPNPKLIFCQTATLLSIVSAVNIVVFMIVLPTSTTLIEKKLGWSADRINLYVGRISSLLLAGGTALIALAAKIGLVIFGLWTPAIRLVILGQHLIDKHSLDHIRKRIRDTTRHPGIHDVLSQFCTGNRKTILVSCND